MSIMKPSADNCRDSASVGEYLTHVKLALAAGRTVIGPETREQLEALMEAYPSIGRRFLPNKRALVAMGLPRWFGRDVEPFDELFQERFLATLKSDDGFRIAVRHFLGGAR
jgi:hypothetical protein